MEHRTEVIKVEHGMWPTTKFVARCSCGWAQRVPSYQRRAAEDEATDHVLAAVRGGG